MNKTIDFSIPQRQSILGIVVMFFMTAQKIVRAFWPILIIWIVKFNQTDKVIFFSTIFGSLLVIALFALAQYYYFTFYIDSETQEFIIQKGVFNKSKIAIQLHKIQQVNIEQTLIQRIVDVHKLVIDTAGSDKKEGTIYAVTKEIAQILKEKLVLQSETTTDSNSSIESQNTQVESTIVKVDIGSLFKIGLTSNYVRSFALILLFIATIFENLNKFNSNDIENRVVNYLDNLSLYFSIMLVLGIFIVVAVLVNIVRTIVKYFDLQIKKDKESILISYGLINIKNTILTPNKVQKIRIVQNYFQKKWNVTSLNIEQSSNALEKHKDKLIVPGCTENEKEEILKILFNKLPNKGKMILPNWRKLALNIAFFLLLPLIVFNVINSFYELITLTSAIFISIFFIVFAGLLIGFSFRNYKLFVSKDFIMQQNGAWDKELNIIEPYKIQAIKTQQFFWQKSTNIGSVKVITAGGTIEFSTANYIVIKQLVNYWLYQVESTNRNWI